MIRKIFKRNKLKSKNFYVDPDEIFLDSKNIENFDSQQFEGRIEKPISKRNITFLAAFFIIFSSTFIVRLGFLQIKKGEAYFNRSENNTFSKTIIFADRGIIYDRNRRELAWNEKLEDTTILDANQPTPATKLVDLINSKKQINFGVRSYLSPGFSHLLGYVSSPSQDKTGKYWQQDFIGKDGLEKQYGEAIKGTNGSNMIETDVHGNILYQNTVNPPKRGMDLVTTIDSGVQGKLFELIKNLADERSFAGGAGVIMDIDTGEILASTSYPEYDSEILSSGKDTEKIKGYLADKRKVFMDKVISGLYTPGSIVKPFFALGALTEGIISPDKQILSTGSISIPNPYDKSKPTIFKDWKAHGWTDMREAIAVSSDVYFYTIGGGFDGQKGLGIANIEKYARLFGIGTKTGVDIPDERGGTIPNPEWKAKNFKGEQWRIGDTYHTAIGQYGFQVTPLQMVRATAALANYGTLVTPHFVNMDGTTYPSTKIPNMKHQNIDVVKEGMRQAVTQRTVVALNVPYVKVAGKSGTAQLGVNKNKVNSWVIGFFPYDHPKYAFTIMMEAGPSTNGVGASSIMRGLLDWMHTKTPEYLGLPPNTTPETEVKDEEIIDPTTEPTPVTDPELTGGDTTDEEPPVSQPIEELEIAN